MKNQELRIEKFYMKYSWQLFPIEIKVPIVLKNGMLKYEYTDPYGGQVYLDTVKDTEEYIQSWNIDDSGYPFVFHQERAIKVLRGLANKLHFALSKLDKMIEEAKNDKVSN